MNQPKTFYRRPLPDTCTSFSSNDGKIHFKNAMMGGYLESYFSLASMFTTQSDPAYCGLGTLSMILNSLEIDPNRIWKGPWRWFSEEMLDCCVPLEVIQKEGITMDEFVCLARCNGAKAKIIRPESSGLNEFRNAVKKVCSSNDERLVVSYDRRILKQTGSGHFSPIGAYDSVEDKVLILDVARFKYPPHWVSLELIFNAMLTIDKSSQKQRGYIVLSKTDRPSLGRIMRPIVNDIPYNWKDLINSFYTHLNNLLNTREIANIEDFVQLILETTISTNIESYFMSYKTNMENIPKEHQSIIDLVLNNIRNLDLYLLLTKVKQNINPSSNSSLVEESENFQNNYSIELVTIFLLSQPIESYLSHNNIKCFSQELIEDVKNLLNPKDLLEETIEEIQSLKLSLESLMQLCCINEILYCNCKSKK